MKKRRTALLLLVCLLVLFGRRTFWFSYYQLRLASVGGQVSHGRSPSPLSKDECLLVARIREVGLKKDRSEWALVRSALHHTHRHVQATAVVSAGRIGDAAFIDELDTIARRHFGEPIGEAADAVLARIKTENACNKEVSDRALSRKRDMLLGYARLSKQRIEEAARAYSINNRATNAPHYEMSVLRQLADFVADAAESGLPKARDVVGIDFSLDPVSELRVSLAEMPKVERIDWLIETIAHKTTIKTGDYPLIQALADESYDAVEPILAKLRVLKDKEHRTGYAYPGISTLFNALASIGDNRAVPVIQCFVGDRDTWLDYYARQQLERLQDGYRKSYAPDF